MTPSDMITAGERAYITLHSVFSAAVTYKPTHMSNLPLEPTKFRDLHNYLYGKLFLEGCQKEIGKLEA